jgi:hypothetical protein
MKATASPRPFYRSEAFAEDVVGLVAAAPKVEPVRPASRWPVLVGTLAVVVLGTALAVWPALA